MWFLEHVLGFTNVSSGCSFTECDSCPRQERGIRAERAITRIFLEWMIDYKGCFDSLTFFPYAKREFADDAKTR
jgi:hypothetical protein